MYKIYGGCKVHVLLYNTHKEKNSPSLHRDATMGICEQISHKLLKPKCRKRSPLKGFKGPR